MQRKGVCCDTSNYGVFPRILKSLSSPAGRAASAPPPCACLSRRAPRSSSTISPPRRRPTIWFANAARANCHAVQCDLSSPNRCRELVAVGGRSLRPPRHPGRQPRHLAAGRRAHRPHVRRAVASHRRRQSRQRFRPGQARRGADEEAGQPGGKTAPAIRPPAHIVLVSSTAGQRGRGLPLRLRRHQRRAHQHGQGPVDGTGARPHLRQLRRPGMGGYRHVRAGAERSADPRKSVSHHSARPRRDAGRDRRAHSVSVHAPRRASSPARFST